MNLIFSLVPNMLALVALLSGTSYLLGKFIYTIWAESNGVFASDIPYPQFVTLGLLPTLMLVIWGLGIYLGVAVRRRWLEGLQKSFRWVLLVWGAIVLVSFLVAFLAFFAFSDSDVVEYLRPLYLFPLLISITLFMSALMFLGALLFWNREVVIGKSGYPVTLLGGLMFLLAGLIVAAVYPRWAVTYYATVFVVTLAALVLLRRGLVGLPTLGNTALALPLLVAGTFLINFFMPSAPAIVELVPRSLGGNPTYKAFLYITDGPKQLLDFCNPQAGIGSGQTFEVEVLQETASHIVFRPLWQKEYDSCKQQSRLEEVWRLPNETVKAILYDKPK